MLKHMTAAAALALTFGLALPGQAFTRSQPDGLAGPGSIPVPHQAGSGNNYSERQKASDWRGSRLIGAQVYDSDNAEIGKIEDVLIGSSGTVDSMVVDVGAFLGVGEKRVAIPFDAFSIARMADGAEKVHVTYSRADLTNAPKFAYYRPSGAETTGSGAPVTNPLPHPK
jgi:sporulation protein YlmC with PRC-barrel domain